MHNLVQHDAIEEPAETQNEQQPGLNQPTPLPHVQPVRLSRRCPRALRRAGIQDGCHRMDVARTFRCTSETDSGGIAGWVDARIAYGAGYSGMDGSG